MFMMRASLRRIPLYAPPHGYGLRTFQPGDEQAWASIHELADKYDTFSPGRFQEEFSEGNLALRERQLYVVDAAGVPVGTSTAWFAQATIPSVTLGRLHWLAVLPEHQGRGLGVALVSATLQRLRQLDHTGAYLTTSSARRKALRLYELFGFSATDPPYVPEANTIVERVARSEAPATARREDSTPGRAPAPEG